MTSIRGYTDLILAGAVGDVNEMQTSFLGTIRANIDRIGSLVSDLADISRLESGRLRLDFREVFAAVLRSAPALDPFRLREDVYGIVLAVVSSVGTAAQLGSEHLLVLIHGMEPPDPQLLLRHLEGVLKRYFPTLAERQELGLHPELRSWSGPPEQAEEILESFD